MYFVPKSLSLDCVFLRDFLHETADLNLGSAMAPLVNSLRMGELSVSSVCAPLSTWVSIDMETSSGSSVNSGERSAVAVLQSSVEMTFFHSLELIIYWVWVGVVRFIIDHSSVPGE